VIIYTALSRDFYYRAGECKRGLAMSVCQTRGLWRNGKKICPDFYTIRKIS